MYFGVLQDKIEVQDSGLLGCEGVVLVKCVQTFEGTECRRTHGLKI